MELKMKMKTHKKKIARMNRQKLMIKRRVVEKRSLRNRKAIPNPMT